MNQRHECLAVILLIACVSGCCNCRPGQGLLSNIDSARIAAPGTNTQLPQVARVGEPYYNPSQNAASQQPSVNAQQGWRPAGAQVTQPPASNPTTLSAPGNPGPLPSSNVVTASNTTLMPQNPQQPTAQMASAANGLTPTLSLTPNGNTVSGGMPLSDATRVSAPASVGAPQNMVSSNSGILGRAWEYVAQPTPQYPTGAQYPAQYLAPSPNSLSNTMVTTSSTGAQFTRPRFNGYPVNANGNAVADGWKQREDYNGIPR